MCINSFWAHDTPTTSSLTNMTIQQDPIESDPILRGWDEYFSKLDPTTSEGVSIPSVDIEQLSHSRSFDSPHPFESLAPQTSLDTRQTQEYTQNSFLVVRNVLNFGFPHQIVPPIYEPNIFGDATSIPPPLYPPLQPFQAITFLPPEFRIIPQIPYGQGRNQSDFNWVEPIAFWVDGCPGVNMADALHNKFHGLVGRDDPVLQDRKNAFFCRFLFLGYPTDKPFQIFTKRWNNARDPLVRSRLAHQVARGLKQYLDSMMRSSHPMDGSPENDRAIGKGIMIFENMYMARLHCVSKGSFQPEIWVRDPAVRRHVL